VTELPTWLTIAGAIAAAVGGVGGLTGIALVLKARAERAKLAAEAEKLAAESEKVEADAASQLTDVALKLVTPLSNELTALRAAHSTTQARVGQLESDQRTQHMLLVEHSVWDHLVLARMKDSGVELPPIPPLFPPTAPAQPAPAAAPSTEVTVAVTTTPAEPAT